ncbi:hypothetical protein [Sulfitobacter sabulilitoris]|nr:hypothetical protein [Sulfitobacter sabulilitoris]
MRDRDFGPDATGRMGVRQRIIGIGTKTADMQSITGSVPPPRLGGRLDIT